MTQEFVSVTIDFNEAVTLPPNAKVHVKVLDTTMADAPSVTVGEVVIDSFNGMTVTTPSARVVAGIEDASRDYAVSVTVDMDSKDGEGLHKGDYISTESCPVLTRGNPSNVTVRVQKI